MTITELLDLPTKDLEAISDEDLIKHLAKYFPHTRPKSALQFSDLTAGNKSLEAMVAELESADKARPRIRL